VRLKVAKIIQPWQGISQYKNCKFRVKANESGGGTRRKAFSDTSSNVYRALRGASLRAFDFRKFFPAQLEIDVTRDDFWSFSARPYRDFRGSFTCAVEADDFTASVRNMIE
jgi:hypothetical protein